MADIDAVLERLINDPAFREELRSDPKTALAGYTLSADDLDLLVSQLSDDSGYDGSVETRTSKAGLVAIFGELFSD